MTCHSCTQHTGTGCALNLSVFPNGSPQRCRVFEYEPGSDEGELPPKARAIESEFGEPFIDVLRGFAEMGYSRSDTAGALGYSRAHFTRHVLPRVDPEGSIPWPGPNQSVAAREGMEQRRMNIGWRAALSEARHIQAALAA